MTEVYKVSLTVKEPMEIVGFFSSESEDALITELTPSLIQRWGADGFVVDAIEIATEEEMAFMQEVKEVQAKDFN